MRGTHEEIFQEASKRLAALMPNLSAERLAEVAEAVTKAVERHNAKEDAAPQQES